MICFEYLGMLSLPKCQDKDYTNTPMNMYNRVYTYTLIICTYVVKEKNENMKIMQSSLGDATKIHHEMTCCGRKSKRPH